MDTAGYRAKALAMLAFFLCFVCVSRSGVSTTFTEVDVKCPICGNAFEASVVTSTNTFGGQDTDFLERAMGFQPILIYPITCSKCYYTGHQSDFGEGVEIAEEDKARIRKGLKPLVEIKGDSKPEDIPAWARYDIPAWARYDLLAQRLKLMGEEKEAIADAYLSASWAVRLAAFEEPPFDDETKSRVQELFEKRWKSYQHDETENPAEQVVLIGRQLKETAARSTGDERLMAGLAAVFLLREHGENAEVKDVLAIIKSVMPEEQFEALKKELTESIALERRFQKQAAELFEEVAGAEEDKESKAVLTYLCGEIHRRLENWEQARKSFDGASKMAGPEWLPELIEKQQKLLPPPKAE